MSLVEFAAWKHSLQNKVVLAVHDEWHDMNISVDRDQEHPLSGTLWVFDDINIFLL